LSRSRKEDRVFSIAKSNDLVISVKSQGSVTVKLNVITKGMESFGYSLSQ
jgi:hypothetical protein